ncbi:MAG TPA: hypothetical protein VLT90_03045 [Terriglobales bacterium]|nr:hypothetical protein [Terriglobales bacterium]
MTIDRISYHDWPESILLSNCVVEAIVVPALGRVMQFRFAGDETGPFWENPELHGQLPDAHTNGWLNFGGDKAWPAPQTEWEQHTGQSWPPPSAFDSKPFHASVADEKVVLVSEVDPHYGVRVVRHIKLLAKSTQLAITTEFQKHEGVDVEISVWVITQLAEPDRVFVLLPGNSHFPNGYQQQRGPSPTDLRRDGRLLSLRRDPREYVKIGTEGTSMLWMNQRMALLICTEETAGVYPDGGSRTEVYTNPNPHCYVELETTGPLATLAAGARISRTNSYTLVHRSTPDCMLEARRVFRI